MARLQLATGEPIIVAGMISPDPRDRTRNAVIGEKNVQLTHLEEAYTSENWLVRIYRVSAAETQVLILFG